MEKQRVIFGIVILLLASVLSGCIEENTSPINQVVIEGKGSYSSIQEAVDAASDGDTIHVYEGVYYGSIVINKSISLIGEGEDKTIIDYNRNESGIIIFIDSDKCKINGFTVTNNINQFYEKDVINKIGFIKGIKINSSNNVISNNTISNTIFGIEVSGGSNNFFSNNTILNNQNGIEISHSSNNIISSNNISLNSQFGILLFYESQHNEISLNAFSNNYEAIHLQDVMYNTISKNTLINNTKEIEECCGAKNNIITQNIYR